MNKNFKTMFNKSVKDFYWKNNYKEIIDNFYAVCKGYIINAPHEYMRNWIKNTAGYNGIGAGNGIQSRYQTKVSSTLKGTEYTHDHLVGATQVGKIIEEFILSKEWKNKKIREKWIYDHLYLWGTIKVSKKEHQEKNIGRGPKYSVANRILFKHYINVSSIITY